MTSLMVLNLQVQLLILMNVMAQTIIFICKNILIYDKKPPNGGFLLCVEVFGLKFFKSKGQIEVLLFTVQCSHKVSY
jgi:hypothetical protein